jgi:D-alanine-D-alanine ligase
MTAPPQIDIRSARVLVLGGGPDSEREVSLESSRGVAEALGGAGVNVRYEVVGSDRTVAGAPLSARALRDLGCTVVFPVLHGPWGEGGPLQDLLEQSGLAFVGCRGPAARLAMDKMATKLAAARVGVPTAAAGVLRAGDGEPCVGLPCVVKPIHEGSSVGVHICRDREAWTRAADAVASDRTPGRVWMVERAVTPSTEVTVGVLDGLALAPIRIVPTVEFYDYQAKYTRDDTRYEVDSPALSPGLKRMLCDYAAVVAREVGVRHLARVDFLIDQDQRPWLLEVNSMPGFTSHSLLPMAAAHAGLDFPALVRKLVELALRDASEVVRA